MLARRRRSTRAASPPVTFKATITASTTSSAVVAISSRTSHTPPGRRNVRAVAIATAVLPIPPGPTTTTSRSVAMRSETSAISPYATDELGRHRREVSDRQVGHGRGWVGDVQRRVVYQDLVLELPQLRARDETEVVRQQRARTRRYAASASAWRPARYSAVISSPHRLSW